MLFQKDKSTLEQARHISEESGTYLNKIRPIVTANHHHIALHLMGQGLSVFMEMVWYALGILAFVFTFIMNSVSPFYVLGEVVAKKALLKQTGENMIKALSHFESEVLKIRAGKASPQMLDGLTVEYYGSPTPLAQVANITAVDARTLTIQAWEKNMIASIERSFLQANLGVTPQNDGILIKNFYPHLLKNVGRSL